MMILVRLRPRALLDLARVRTVVAVLATLALAALAGYDTAREPEAREAPMRDCSDTVKIQPQAAGPFSRRQFVGGIPLILLAASACSSSTSGRRPTNVDRPEGVPVSPFGPASTAEEVTAGVDLSGLTALVTGATSGLGFETLRVLTLRGAHVIATGRTRARAAEACAEAGATDRTTPLGVDLEDWAGIVAATNAVRERGRPVDILICNAGIMHPTELRLVNGFEQQFAVNHLGHFILCHRLLDLVRSAHQGRIVVVSSQLMSQAPASGIDFDNLDGGRGFDTFRMYGQSKLANALMAFELARRLQGTTSTSNSLHPGVAHTNLDRSKPPWRRAISRLLSFRHGHIKSIPAAAATQAHLAASRSLATTSGFYFEDCNPVVPPSRYARDANLAEALWTWSEEATRAYLS